MMDKDTMTKRNRDIIGIKREIATVKNQSWSLNFLEIVKRGKSTSYLECVVEASLHDVNMHGVAWCNWWGSRNGVVRQAWAMNGEGRRQLSGRWMQEEVAAGLSSADGQWRSSAGATVDETET